MKEIIYSFLLMLDEATNTGAMIISIVSGVIAIVVEIRKHKAEQKGSWIWKCIIIVSILVILGTITRKNLTEVPDVVGYTYEDAKGILVKYELKYNLVVDKGLYVVEQNPVARTPVRKGTKVELSTERNGNNAELRDGWKGSLNGGYGNVAITFKDMDIVLMDEGQTLECFGPQITNYNVERAFLVEETSGVEYHDYAIEDNIMIFKDIPKGITFKLYVLLSGYEAAETDVIISSQNTVKDTYSFTFGITKSNEDVRTPSTFYVANGNSSTIGKVDYMPEIKMWVMWPDNYAWRGDYFTDESGQFEYSIRINDDKKIKVQLFNPFGNGKDYECEVELRAAVVGEPVDSDIIFLNEDGSCEVIRESKYFMW